MGTGPVSSGQYFFILNVLFWSLFAGNIVLASLIFFITVDLSNPDPGFINLLLIIFPLLAFSALLGSLFIFRAKMNAIDPKKKLGEKLSEYRSSLIVRWSIIESACYLSIVAWVLTRQTLLLAIVAFLLIYFILQKPGPVKAIADLKLNEKEQALVNDPEAIVMD